MARKELTIKQLTCNLEQDLESRQCRIKDFITTMEENPCSALKFSSAMFNYAAEINVYQIVLDIIKSCDTTTEIKEIVEKRVLRSALESYSCTEATVNLMGQAVTRAWAGVLSGYFRASY